MGVTWHFKRIKGAAVSVNSSTRKPTEKRSVMFPYINQIDSSVNSIQEIDHKTFNYIYP